eukprot:m.364430 g.364430  ORF g.364430 m.364430 type:complete len:157 (-) comp28080_c0_seq3:450-920(-)
MVRPWSATRVAAVATALSTALGVARADGGGTNVAISKTHDVLFYLIVLNVALISLAFLATTMKYLRIQSARKREVRESQRAAEWELDHRHVESGSLLEGLADSRAPSPPRYGAGGAVVFNGTAFHENPPSPNTKVVGGAPQRHSKRSKRPTTTLKN